MTYLARQKVLPAECVPQVVLPTKFNDTMERWLSGDQLANMAPLMYVGDIDAYRWEKGHSSSDYYVKKDENAVLATTMEEIDGKYENLLDMGVGGDEAVARALKLGNKVGAKTYVP